MAEFKLALPTVFFHEGRYVNDSRDLGGATNFGVSLRFLMSTGDLDRNGWPDGDINHDGKINAEDIKILTKEQAAELYRLYFWDPNGYDRIYDQGIATKLFDLGINMGTRAAHVIAQRAVRSATGIKLIDDGILGLQTIAGINMAKPEKLMAAIKSEAAGYYRLIVERKPALSVYLNGWLNRAMSDPIIEVKK